jgi:hypothetical protein
VINLADSDSSSDSDFERDSEGDFISDSDDFLFDDSDFDSSDDEVPDAKRAATAQQIRRLTITKVAVGAEEECCAICLDNMTVGQSVRQLRCKHAFHVICVDEWLITNKSCPHCRLDCC